MCMSATHFVARDRWFRDNLLCESCVGGSIPRERALMMVLRQLRPDWETLSIHESSPAPRGVSQVLSAQAPNYLATQFFPGVAPGEMFEGVRCENLEAQTFRSGEFDLVITQDVMEHVFHPERAYTEVFRTLKPGGFYIHTTPMYKGLATSIRKAEIDEFGQVKISGEPEYHGNPISGEGSLVTFQYGYDLPDLISRWTAFDVEVRRFVNRTHGIIAEFTEVIICRKPG